MPSLIQVFLLEGLQMAAGHSPLSVRRKKETGRLACTKRPVSTLNQQVPIDLPAAPGSPMLLLNGEAVVVNLAGEPARERHIDHSTRQIAELTARGIDEEIGNAQS